ncbi:outer membrane protein [Paraurantiacibacter namhicola]|uniref:Outer membrane protein beta-barrel domain-containing protein n=1 Tax=Paraurantiacibacter namhicola TaxID=645517 RepID=A0A1C7D7T0_9SPHN|nr:porin family protein [Paraurantiacibacter namhicola]ANU07497.1 hypothetical protein A6F65_01190 [Paraurantiacibacter namhicola]
MKTNVSFALAALCGLLSTPAMAQDGEFSIGVLAGADNVKVKDGGSETDVMYGVTAGYDFNLEGGLVVGLQVEASDSEVKEVERDVFFAGDTVTTEATRDLYVGARVGYRTGPALIYAKAGYSNAGLRTNFQLGTVNETDNDTLDGVRLGAGVEYPVGDMFAVRAEYRYTDYKAVTLPNSTATIDFSRHQGVIAAVVKF